MMIAYFPRTRIEHLVMEGKTTLCGKDASLAARFHSYERGGDAKVRPLCPSCRRALPAR